jgi:hypothetical protein
MEKYRGTMSAIFPHRDQTRNRICVFGRPLNYPKRSDIDTDPISWREPKTMVGTTFKGLSPSTTPPERESFVGCVKLRIPKATALSIEKRTCENYLFEDYHWKSGIKS